MNKNRHQYNALKKNIDFYKHSIKYNHVLAQQFVSLTYSLSSFKKKKIKSLVSPFFKTINFHSLKDAFAANRIVVTNVTNRADYVELINKYFEKSDDWDRVSLEELNFRFCFKIMNILQSVVFVFTRKLDLTFLQKLYISAHLSHYLNITDGLVSLFNHFNFNEKVYVPFNSAYDIETLLTQFFKSKGCKVIHISHALSYVNFKYDTVYDFINGENITAKNITVWGESSKLDLINNYNIGEDSIKICGNPKYPEKIINVSKEFSKCVVFLGRPIYDEYNIELIKLLNVIAKKYGIEFTIKPHPFSDFEKLNAASENGNISVVSGKETIFQLLNSGIYNFAISYNTTAYFEAMYYNLICLRFSVFENEVFHGLDDNFFDEVSFMKQLDKFKKIDIEQINADVSKTLIYNLGMGITEYLTMFN
ncbi:hypothetical protein [Parasediminibacterium sp. JCM 36343]|uniref:hypothetical protein n=1 Tax=Parasediminibacterium sp. JCM 36343 TaxID=3374279 RepID=UPI003978B2F8